jgi:hypothetical protein
MLPTDSAMEHGSNCNTIQNALQKIKVHISFDQAAIVLNELQRELPELFRLRRKEKRSPAKQPNNKRVMPLLYPCSECGSSGVCAFVGSNPCPRR